MNEKVNGVFVSRYSGRLFVEIIRNGALELWSATNGIEPVAQDRTHYKLSTVEGIAAKLVERRFEQIRRLELLAEQLPETFRVQYAKICDSMKSEHRAVIEAIAAIAFEQATAEGVE